MAGRAVTPAEHRRLHRSILHNAAEIVEAFKAVYEDNIKIEPDKALEMLEELRNCIDSVYADLDPVEETVEFKSDDPKDYIRVSRG